MLISSTPTQKSVTTQDNTLSLSVFLNTNGHQCMCNDFLNQGLKSKKEGEASFHSNSSWEVFELCQQEKSMLKNSSPLLGNCTSFCRAQGHHQVLNLYQEGRRIRLGEKENETKKPQLNLKSWLLLTSIREVSQKIPYLLYTHNICVQTMHIHEQLPASFSMDHSYRWGPGCTPTANQGRGRTGPAPPNLLIPRCKVHLTKRPKWHQK